MDRGPWGRGVGSASPDAGANLLSVAPSMDPVAFTRQLHIGFTTCEHQEGESLS